MAKNSYRVLTAFSLPPWYGDHKNMKENQIPRRLFEGSTTLGKNKLPNGLDWPCYLGGSSKSHRYFFFHIYVIYTLRRYEKCCQIPVRIFYHFIASDSYCDSLCLKNGSVRYLSLLQNGHIVFHSGLQQYHVILGVYCLA